MSERRTHNRSTARVVFDIVAGDQKDRAGVSRDVSAGGALFHSVSRFQVGQSVTLRFFCPDSRNDRRQNPVEVVGTVVRTSEVPKQFVMRHLAAVRFERLVPELEQLAQAV